MQSNYVVRAITVCGLACVVAGPATALASEGFASEVQASQTRTHTNNDGNTVEVRRNRNTNEEGDTRYRRGYRVIDSEGDIVSRGHDRGRVDADGRRAHAQRREHVDEAGNRHQQRRRAQADGEGNARVQRHRRTLNADGDVTQRARGSARRAADGQRVKRNQRQFTDQRGRKTDVRKRVRVDANGNRNVRRTVRR